MSEESDKKRFTVTVPAAYVEALDWMVKVGIYLDHQATIRDALRQLFRFHKIQPFCPELVEEPGEN